MNKTDDDEWGDGGRWICSPIPIILALAAAGLVLWVCLLGLIWSLIF